MAVPTNARPPDLPQANGDFANVLDPAASDAQEYAIHRLGTLAARGLALALFLGSFALLAAAWWDVLK